MKNLFIDRKYRLPRKWSNKELRKFASLFSGDIANVSGWRDGDKEGGCYKDYFINASTYTITNFKSEAMGFQGHENEIFLDLEKDISQDLLNKFDVVFNHTVLEHIFDVNKAFKNLCSMTKDVAIVIVPFLQQMHSEFGDYWRFTPLTIERLFRDNSMTPLYLSFNNHKNSSVYIFCIASKNPKVWVDKIANDRSFIEKNKPLDGFEPYVGCNAIDNSNFCIWYLLAKLKKIIIKR